MGMGDAVDWKKLAAEMQQQVPPGNPIADHYQQRADDLSMSAATGAVGGGVLGGIGLAELLEGNPLAILALLGGGGMALAGGAASDLGKQRQGTADMWFNRFGSGDPNQGLPGTPSGPAWRRK